MSSNGNPGPNPGDTPPDTPLKLALAAIVAAVGSGLGATVAKGPWQVGLLALCVLAAAVFAYTLVSAGAFHRMELQEATFERSRDDDAERRGQSRHEREVRTLVADASERPGGPDEQRAAIETMLEKLRRQMTSGRSSSVELLFVDDSDGLDAPSLVASAGQFDQAALRSTRALREFIDSLGYRAYAARVRIRGRNYRLLGIADPPLGPYDQSAIEAAAGQVQSLMLAHIVGGLAEPLYGEEVGP